MKTMKEMKVITEEATPGPSGSAARGRLILRMLVMSFVRPVLGRGKLKAGVVKQGCRWSVFKEKCIELSQ